MERERSDGVRVDESFAQIESANQRAASSMDVNDVLQESRRHRRSVGWLGHRCWGIEGKVGGRTFRTEIVVACVATSANADGFRILRRYVFEELACLDIYVLGGPYRWWLAPRSIILLHNIEKRGVDWTFRGTQYYLD